MKVFSRLHLNESRLALLVSGVALIITILDFAQLGIVAPLEPSGYAIIRGDGSFPSDMLVLPIEWKNESGRAALIRRPELILDELNADGLETGISYRFTLAGEYPEISYPAFQERYAFENSFVIAGHSVPVKNLVFHSERWWDEDDPLYAFRFTSGKRYRVTIKYQLNAEDDIVEHELFVLPTFERADVLQSNRSESYWDYWHLDRRQ